MQVDAPQQVAAGRGIGEPETHVPELEAARGLAPAAVACRGDETVIGASSTSKNRSVALAASLDMASSQPIESIGQRSPNATPKNATSVPADRRRRPPA